MTKIVGKNENNKMSKSNENEDNVNVFNLQISSFEMLLVALQATEELAFLLI